MNSQKNPHGRYAVHPSQPLPHTTNRSIRDHTHPERQIRGGSVHKVHTKKHQKPLTCGNTVPEVGFEPGSSP